MNITLVCMMHKSLHDHCKNDKIMSMKIVDKIEDKLNKDVSARLLMKIVLLLVIVWLCIQTAAVWGWIANRIWTIICPFVIGFVIAYILRTPISWGEKHHIKRGVMVAICYIVILLFFAWILSSIIPLLLSRMSDFINSIISGVNWLYDKYNTLADNSTQSVWVKEIVVNATDSLRDLGSLVPELSNSIPEILNSAIGTITNGIFALIISIFMCIGWDKIRYEIIRLSRRISRTCFECVLAVNDQVSSYIRSLLILMVIKFFEYSIVYLLIGHTDWMILALMTSISLLVPYIGPTIVNCIGILTALTIPGGRVILLIILIIVLSQVDEYVIAPLVHSHNTAVTPLWALFSIFASSALLGVPGLIIAIPAFLAIRVVYMKLHFIRPEDEDLHS